MRSGEKRWVVMWHETTNCKLHMKHFANEKDAKRFADEMDANPVVYQLCVSEEIAL